MRRIESTAYSEMALDTADEVCYTGENTEAEELIMTKILFVCLGNTCRSPMAEFLMKDLVEKVGLPGPIRQAVNPPAAGKLAGHGISCAGKFSRQLIKADYDRFDLLIGMDNLNLVTMQYIFGNDLEGKLHRLLDYTENPRNLEQEVDG